VESRIQGFPEEHDWHGYSYRFHFLSMTMERLKEEPDTLFSNPSDRIRGW
jgi:hypothetical protein